MNEKQHKYDYKIALDDDSGPARVVRLVGKEKRVLEIGAGPGSITRLLAEVSNCRVTALEIDAESVKKLIPCCERVYQADLNAASWPELLEKESKFEVIVAADVLEHVYEPLTVLKAMQGFLDTEGYMVISLPHIGYSAIHACLLEEDFGYSDSALLDRTHIRFFGIRNIQQLFEDAGMKIVHAEFVVRNPEYTEFAKRWAKTPAELRAVLAGNPFGLVYQVIVKAVPWHAGGAAVSLMNMKVVHQTPPFRESVKAFLRLHLSAKAYAGIQAAAAKIRRIIKNLI